MSTAAAATITSLRALVEQSASRDTIATFLNGLNDADRIEEALSLRGKQVGRLYHAVAGGPVTTIADFVPKATPSDTTIIFEGRNSLPTFTSFQKRFARLPSGQVVGYNHQTMSFATGPGFFVLKEASDDADVKGEAYFDYTAAPERVPAGWPAFKSNDAGISTLVYKGMKDYMRKVADHTYVGEAYKGGKSQKAFFVLTRAAS